MTQKLFMLLPSSCVAPSIAGGGAGGKPLVEKEGSLKIESGHGDKKRQYNPTIYSIVFDGEVYITGAYFFPCSSVYQNQKLDFVCHNNCFYFIVPLKQGN